MAAARGDEKAVTCGLEKDEGRAAVTGSINPQTAGPALHTPSKSLLPDDTNSLSLKTVTYRL